MLPFWNAFTTFGLLFFTTNNGRLGSQAMPSSQFLDTIELAANGTVLLGLIMAEYYPDDGYREEACTTDQIEKLFGISRSLLSDCKNSITPGELLWKFRRSVMQKLNLAAIEKAANLNLVRETLTDDNFPGKIPDLRLRICEMIDKAKADCARRVEHFLVLPEDDVVDEGEFYQDELMCEQLLLNLESSEEEEEELCFEAAQISTGDEEQDEQVFRR